MALNKVCDKPWRLFGKQGRLKKKKKIRTGNIGCRLIRSIIFMINVMLFKNYLDVVSWHADGTRENRTNMKVENKLSNLPNRNSNWTSRLS